MVAAKIQPPMYKTNPFRDSVVEKFSFNQLFKSINGLELTAPLFVYKVFRSFLFKSPEIFCEGHSEATVAWETIKQLVGNPPVP